MASKTARLDLRLTEPQRELIRQAAAISGSTVSGFAIHQLVEAASRVVSQARSVALGVADWDRFLDALGAADEPEWIELKTMKPVWER
jgi:uncharacterized protein (DUF1778 family)